MFFHCRSSEAPADKPGNHGRKKRDCDTAISPAFDMMVVPLAWTGGVSALMTAAPPAVERLPDLFQGGIVFRFGLFKASLVLEQGAR